MQLEDTGLSDDGNGYWVLMFSSSDASQTTFGGFFLNQYYSKTIASSTDLSSGTHIVAGGDSVLNRFPSSLFRRLEIKDTPHYVAAAPRLDNFLASKLYIK